MHPLGAAEVQRCVLCKMCIAPVTSYCTPKGTIFTHLQKMQEKSAASIWAMSVSLFPVLQITVSCPVCVEHWPHRPHPCRRQQSCCIQLCKRACGKIMSIQQLKASVCPWCPSESHTQLRSDENKTNVLLCVHVHLGKSSKCDSPQTILSYYWLEGNQKLSFIMNYFWKHSYL